MLLKWGQLRWHVVINSRLENMFVKWRQVMGDISNVTELKENENSVPKNDFVMSQRVLKGPIMKYY